MYADVVHGVDHHVFEDMLGEFKARKRLHELDTDITADEWRELIPLQGPPSRKSR
jgi:hypothetical protein